MGGYGSGRPARYPKSDQMLRLDISQLERRGYLRGGLYRYSWSWGREGDHAGSISLLSLTTGLKLSYRTSSGDGEWQDVDELVPFLWTPLKFGGQRDGSSASNVAGAAVSSMAVGATLSPLSSRPLQLNRRREPVAPLEPCSRSSSASIPSRSATTSHRSRRACTGAPTIGSRTGMSTTTLSGHSRQCGGSDQTLICAGLCSMCAGSAPDRYRHTDDTCRAGPRPGPLTSWDRIVRVGKPPRPVRPWL